MYILLILSYMLYIIMFFTKIKPNIYYKIIGITIPIPIIFFDPIETYLVKGFYVDTVRIFSEINTFRNYGWNGTDIYDYFILSKIYIFSFSFLEQEENFLLPVLNSFVIYSCTLYMVYKIGKYFVVEYKYINYIILYTTLMISFFNVTTNIRYPLAISMAFILLTYDLIKKKYRILCFIGYFILLFLHPGIVFVVILRLLICFSNVPILLIALLIIILGNNTILSLMAMLPIDMILGLIDKVDTYSDSSSIQEVPIYYLLVMLSYNVCVILIAGLLYKFLKYDIYNRYRGLIKMTFILGMIGSYATLIGNSGFLGRAEELSRYLIAILYFLFLKRDSFMINDKSYGNFKLFVNIIYGYTLIYFLYNILTYTRWLL